MTLVELQKLVAESKGEWEHLEFKKTTGELHGGMETLCGFLNGTGGKVLVASRMRAKFRGKIRPTLWPVRSRSPGCQTLCTVIDSTRHGPHRDCQLVPGRQRDPAVEDVIITPHDLVEQRAVNSNDGL